MARIDFSAESSSHDQNERCRGFRITVCPDGPYRQQAHLRAVLLIILVLLTGFLSGCGGSSKPISVSAIAASTTLDGGNSTTITASVANDKNGAGVAWGMSGPGALSNQTNSSVTYTAPAPSTMLAIAKITATSAADSSKAASVTISIPAKPTILTDSLMVGDVGSPYSAQLGASGGIPPYSWTISTGTLPSCMTMSSSGLLSSSGGLMASCAGTVDLGFKVTDSGKPTALTATTTLSLVVNAAPAITFAESMPAHAAKGTAYIGSAAASGGAGALTYSIQSGNLPTGLKLNAATGAIAGLPAANGSFNFTVKAADAYGDSGTYPCQITVMDPLALTDVDLSTIATINVAFSGTVVASGGSGNYAWQVTGLPDSGLASSASGNTLTVSGTPSALGTVNFGVRVTDTDTQAVLTRAYTIEIGNPTPVGLSGANPPAATVNQPYAAVITASGGVGPYSWSINSATVTSAGISLSNGLSVSNRGSNKLSITGTPTSTDAVILNNVRVVDSLNTSATQTYTITVNAAGAQVKGHIRIGSYCGTEPMLPPITVSIDTTPSRQTITDPDGSFMFEDVPDGTYTVTPSTAGPPAEPSSAFNPSSAQVSVNIGQAGALSFRVMLGYTISGSVAYHGAIKGQTYINLNGECSSAIGTSISQDALASGGAFTLHGVPPGRYWIAAAIDPSTLGNGVPNYSDPISSSLSQIEVSTTNIAGLSITMIDQPYVETYAPPTLKSVSPTNSGVVISYDGSSVVDWWYTGWEAWSSYTVQWSTNKEFSGTPASATFKAVGTGYAAWILNNGNDGMSGTLTPGTAYYLRVRGTNAAGNSEWAYWAGSGNTCSSSTCAQSVTIGEPSGSTYANVTGSVNITSEMASIITGPLYVGYFDPNTGATYGYVVANPINGENPYTIPVLKSSTTGYIPFGILDQNKDGLVDVGDVTNLVDNPPPTIINSDTTGLIELSYLYDQPRVQTHYLASTAYNNGSAVKSSSYSLKFVNTPAKKLPLSVQLTAGPNVAVPLDIGKCGDGCGTALFSDEVFLGGSTPTIGDTYTFHVTFSDGTSWDEYAQVTAFSGTSSIAGTDSVPTNLAPSGSVPGQTRPTFSWTYPNFPNQTATPTLYQFSVCCSWGDIWRIPASGSALDGFTATQIPGSITWAVDPTNATNKPWQSMLTPGETYTWQIQARDDLGNVTTAQTTFIP